MPIAAAAHHMPTQEDGVCGPVDEHLFGPVRLSHVHNAGVGGQVPRLHGLLQSLLDGDPGPSVQLEGVGGGEARGRSRERRGMEERVREERKTLV